MADGGNRGRTSVGVELDNKIQLQLLELARIVNQLTQFIQQNTQAQERQKRTSEAAVLAAKKQIESTEAHAAALGNLTDKEREHLREVDKITSQQIKLRTGEQGLADTYQEVATNLRRVTEEVKANKQEQKEAEAITRALTKANEDAIREASKRDVEIQKARDRASIEGANTQAKYFQEIKKEAESTSRVVTESQKRQIKEGMGLLKQRQDLEGVFFKDRRQAEKDDEARRKALFKAGEASHTQMVREEEARREEIRKAFRERRRIAAKQEQEQIKSEIKEGMDLQSQRGKIGTFFSGGRGEAEGDTERRAQSARKEAEARREATAAAREEMEAIRKKIAILNGDTQATERHTRILREMRVATLAAKTGNEGLSRSLVHQQEVLEKLQRRNALWQKMLLDAKTASYTIGFTLAGMGAAAAGAFGLAVKSAGDMQHEMIRVQKTTDLSDRAIESLSTRFVNMSTLIPLSAKELANIGVIAGQLGINGKDNVEKFTESVAKFSKVTDLGVEQAAEGMAVLSNLFKIPIPDIDHLTSALNVMENTTTATTADLLNMMKRMGGAATNIGLTAAQVAGISATMKDLGVNLEVAGTGMGRFFNAMLNKGKIFAEQLNIPLKEWQRLVNEDALGAMNKWLQMFGRLDKFSRVNAIKQLKLDGERLSGILLKLADAQGSLNRNIERSEDAYRGSSGVNKEFTTLLKSFNTQLVLLKNSFVALMIEGGNPFLTSMTGFVQQTKDAINWIRGFDDRVKSLAIVLGAGIGGTLGLAGILFFLAPRLIAFIDFIKDVSKYLQESAKAHAIFNAVAMANPYIRGAAIVLGILALITAFTDLNFLIDASTIAWDKLKSVLRPVGQAIRDVIDVIKEGIQEIPGLNAIIKAAGFIAETSARGWKGLADSVHRTAEEIRAAKKNNPELQWQQGATQEARDEKFDKTLIVQKRRIELLKQLFKEIRAEKYPQLELRLPHKDIEKQILAAQKSRLELLKQQAIMQGMTDLAAQYGQALDRLNKPIDEFTDGEKDKIELTEEETKARQRAQLASKLHIFQLQLEIAEIKKDEAAIQKYRAEVERLTAVQIAQSTGEGALAAQEAKLRGELEKLKKAEQERNKTQAEAKQHTEAMAEGTKMLIDLKQKEANVEDGVSHRIQKAYEDADQQIAAFHAKELERLNQAATDKIKIEGGYAKRRQELDSVVAELKAQNERTRQAEEERAFVTYNDKIGEILEDATEKQLKLDDEILIHTLTNSRKSAEAKEKDLKEYITKVEKEANNLRSIQEAIDARGVKSAKDSFEARRVAADNFYNHTRARIEREVHDAAEKSRLINEIDAAQSAESLKIAEDETRVRGTLWERVKLGFRDYVDEVKGSHKDMLGIIRTFVSDAVNFLKESFFAIITADLDRLKNAFKSLFNAILKALQDILAGAIAKQIIIWLEKIWEWLKRVLEIGPQKAKFFTREIVSMTLAWAAFNAQLLISSKLLASMKMSTPGVKEGGGGGTISSILNIVSNLGKSNGVIGKATDILSKIPWTRIAQYLPALAPLAGAGLGFVAGKTLGKLLGLSPRGQNIAGGAVGGGIGIGLLAGALGLGPLGVGIAAILGAGGGGFLGSLTGAKPPRVGMVLRGKFEGLILDQLGVISTGLIDLYSGGIKRMSRKDADLIAARAEKIVQDFTQGWANTFNRFPKEIIQSIWPSIQEANQAIAKGLDRVVLVTRDDFSRLVNQFIKNLPARLAKAYVKPINEAIGQIIGLILPDQKGLGSGIQGYLTRFAGVGPKFQQSFFDSIDAITGILAKVNEKKGFFSPDALKNLIESMDVLSAQTKPKDMSKLLEEIKKLDDYVNAVIEFQSNIQDVIDQGTMSEFALELKKLEEQFKADEAAAKALGLSTDKLREAQELQVDALVDKYITPLNEIFFGVNDYLDEIMGTDDSFIKKFNGMLATLKFGTDPLKAIEDAQNAFELVKDWYEGLGDFGAIAENAKSKLQGMKSPMEQIRDIVGLDVTDQKSIADAISILIGRTKGASLDAQGSILKDAEEALALFEKYLSDGDEAIRKEAEERRKAIVPGERDRQKILDEIDRWEKAQIETLGKNTEGMESLKELWRQLQEAALASEQAVQAELTARMTELKGAIDLSKDTISDIIRNSANDIIKALYNLPKSPGDAFYKELTNTPHRSPGDSFYTELPGVPAKNGLDFVPMDDYPIRAHKGEAVITAKGNEALGEILREVRKGGNQPITIVIQPAPIILDGKQVGEVMFKQIQKQGEAGRKIIPDKAVYKR